jgi:hypothetical protein
MPIGELLSNILSPFISGMGGQQQQAAPAPQQQPVQLVGPETPMTPEEQMLIEQGVLSPSAQNPQGIAWGAGASPGYAGGVMNPGADSGGTGMGLTPLAQSLLAGYFSAIGTPKYQGLGSAISRGGLTALDTYGKAQELEAKSALRPYEAAKLSAEASLAMTKAKTEPEYRAALTKKHTALAAQAEAEASVAKDKALAEIDAKIATALKNGTRPVVGPNGEEVYIPLHMATPEGYKDMSLVKEEIKAEGRTSPEERGYLGAKGAQRASLEEPISKDKNRVWVDPHSGKAIPVTTPLGKASEIAIPMSKQEYAQVQGFDSSLESLNRLDAAARALLPKQSELGGTGTFGSQLGIKILRRTNPEKVAEFDNARALFFETVKSQVVKERMSDQDRDVIYQGIPDENDTAESAAKKVVGIFDFLRSKRAALLDPSRLPSAEEKAAAGSSAGKPVGSAAKPQLPEVGGTYSVGDEEFTRVK